MLSGELIGASVLRGEIQREVLDLRKEEQEKTVEAQKEDVVVVPDDAMKVLSKVVVKGVTAGIDENIRAENIKLGVSILGVEGNVAPDKPDQEKTIYPSEEEQVVRADSGYELAKVVAKAVEVESYEVMPSTSEQVVRASEGKWINRVTVNPIQTETLSVVPTQSEQTIEAPQSKYYKKVNVSAVTNSIDPNITAENIKKDVTILGVTGTLESGVEATQQLIDLIEGDITTLNIPNTTSKIKPYSFYNCSGLTNITIPSSVTSIGLYAFNSCSSLTSITIPNSVKSIEMSAFNDCSSLTKVNITDIAKWCSISFGNDFSNPLFYAKNLYLNNTLVTDLVIPSGVTSINSYAFEYCSNLTSITIPSSVTSIGSDVFSNCSSLTSITIPDSVTSIGNSAFRICSSLISITIGNGVTRIGNYVFYNCRNLTEMTILATTPPTLGGTNAISTATTTIYIPAGTLEAYQTATNWSSFASKFVELNEDGSKPE